MIFSFCFLRKIHFSFIIENVGHMLMNIKENYINDEKLPDNCNYEVE